MKKSVLIVGPITDFGGREIEVKLIATSLVTRYNVSLLSTVKMTLNSSALINDKNFEWTTIDKIINKKLLVLFVNLLCKYRFSRKEPAYCLTKNKINGLFLNFDKLYKEILEKELIKHDFILFVGEVTSKWLDDLVSLSNKHKKPIVLRTTGAIFDIPKNRNHFLKKIDKILVHSKANYDILVTHSSNNLKIIDQTALNEKELLQIEININTSNLVYGFLGRFSSEKGILELLNVFASMNSKLIIAGSGPLQNEVDEISSNSNILNLGEFGNDEIHVFFNQIDVLIIPSLVEAGPLVGIEAMASGKLIIATKVGALEDRLKNTQNQFWFKIQDINTLKDVIKTIENLSQESINKIKFELRETYLENYSVEKVKEEYVKLFEQV